MSVQAIKKLKTTLYSSLLAISLLLPVSMGSAAAATAAFSLTPGSGTFNVGDFLTVEIREDSDSTDVNFVEPKLTYNTGVLQFISADTSQSPFTSPAGAPSYGGGMIDIPRGVTGTPIKNSQNVAFLTFKVTGAASTSSMSFAAGSSIKAPVADASSPSGVTVSEAWNGVATGATFVFKDGTSSVNSNPPSTTGGGSTSSGSKTSTSSGSKTSTSTKKTTTKTVAGASSAPPTTATYTPAPGNSSDEDAGGALTPSNHMVTITVVNSKGKPVSDAEVKLGNETTHTLSDGSASFISVADGKYTVSVTYKGKTTKQTITVNAKGQPVSSVQKFNIKLASSSLIPTWVIYTGIGLIVIFLLGLFIPRRRHNFKSYVSKQSAAQVVVGDSKNHGDMVTPTPVQPAKPTPTPQQVLPQAPKVLPGTFIEPNQPPDPNNGVQINNINKEHQ